MSSAAPLWQKSSFSGEGNNCVEVAASTCGGDGLLVRESDAPEVVLSSSRPRMAGLLAAVRAGRLDLPTT